MKKAAFAVLGLILAVAGPACAEGPAPARAVLVNSAGEQVGAARLEEAAGGVKITLEVSKLPPGTHAFHIHAAGKCEPPEFKSAGVHFNPAHKKHGVENPEGPHAGDLPNIEVGADGAGRAEFTAAGVTLGAGENSLFQPEGTSLVIHAGPDDNRTDPSGNSGVRIACGVIERAP